MEEERRVIEAGHHYKVFGPTEWALEGWRIWERIRTNGDKSMLFVDDVHPIENVSKEESCLPICDFSPRADHEIMESQTRSHALVILDRLACLPKRKRAQRRPGGWFCSGFPITNPKGEPNCVLLDAGLTLLKQELGYSRGINILPYYYQEEQENLVRLVAKAIPDFRLEVILFDLDGRHWPMKI